MSRSIAWTVKRAVGLMRRVDRDQQGTISIVTVFALLMFTILLLMIVNVGRHVDDKIKMQNAADAAGYSSGVVLARGMNAVAFTNHLLCDVFAITAYLREGRDRNAEQMVPQVLEAWTQAGQRFSSATFEKFSVLGPAIVDKVPKEQKSVSAFGELTAAASAVALPVFEHILGEPAQPPNDPNTEATGPGQSVNSQPVPPNSGFVHGGQTHLIPEFQRTLIRTIPELAQQTADEIARRHGLFRGEASASQNDPSQRQAARRGQQSGVLWRTTLETVGSSNEEDPLKRTLPVVDPDPVDGDVSVPFAADYLVAAREQRRDMAEYYLRRWNNVKLSFFSDEAKMSQFFGLWVMATCAQLNRLLDAEYPETNLPMLLRRSADGRDVEGIFRNLERGDRRDPNRQLRSRRNELQFPILIEELRSQMDVDQHLEQNFNFVAVVSRRHLAEMGPGIFKNPLNVQADAMTFSQISLFVPFPRRYLRYVGESAAGGPGGRDELPLGGTFGFDSDLLAPPRPGQSAAAPNPRSPEDERWPLENWPTHWDLWNQNWTVRLVPATASTLAEILRNPPYGVSADYPPLPLGNVSSRELKQINTH